MSELIVDVAELVSFAARIEGGARIMTEELTRGGREAGFLVQGSAVGFAPRDTGQLAGSIGPPLVSAGAGSVVTEVRATAEHARYQEEGTGIYAGRGMIRPRSAKFLSWVGKDGKRVFAREVRGVPATRYMKRGLDVNRARIEQLFAEATKRVIARLVNG